MFCFIVCFLEGFIQNNVDILLEKFEQGFTKGKWNYWVYLLYSPPTAFLKSSLVLVFANAYGRAFLLAVQFPALLVFPNPASEPISPSSLIMTVQRGKTLVHLPLTAVGITACDLSQFGCIMISRHDCPKSFSR